MAGTNVPSPTFGPTGFIAPAEADILDGATADINAAFGGNLNPSLATPQGQLAASLAAIIGNVNDLFLLFTNLVDPALSSGRMQDAIARIYFITRIASSPTVAQCLCTGAVGVQIPAGAQAQAEDGNIYICTQAGTIGASGNVTLPFACQTYGPIVCPAGTITTIFQAIFGWDTITNVEAGVEGIATETASAFEARRAASVAQNALGTLPAILGAVLSVPGVIDAYVIDNPLNTTATVGGVSLYPNSLYVAVVGGTAQAVATAIWSRKPPGAVYNGNTTVTVLDTSNGYVAPFPAYSVTFETPASLPIVFAVNIANGPNVPANAAALIQAAIISAFAGEDGGPRASIGATVFASRFYSAVAALWTGVNIISILVGSTNNPAATFTASASGNTLTVTGAVTGTIAVGQSLFDTTGNIIPGTTITALGSGAGGDGTYTISATQTFTPETIMAVVATTFDQPVNINQNPTVTAANIQVAIT